MRAKRKICFGLSTWSATMLLALRALAAPTDQRELEKVLHGRPDLDRGAELFRTCIVCHGSDGEGTSDGSVPAIGGQHMRVIAKQLVDFRHGERREIRMERIASRHVLGGALQIAQVAAYVSGLRPELPTGVGSGEEVTRGGQIYARKCRTCHGADGEGDSEHFIPRLARQNSQYLLREMDYTLEQRRPNMSGPHLRQLRSLHRRELVAVADYLSRLGAPSGRTDSGH